MSVTTSYGPDPILEAGDIDSPSLWDTEPHQWRRYAARSVDGIIFALPMLFVLAAITSLLSTQVAQFLRNQPWWWRWLVNPPLMVLLTCCGVALCHSLWSTTPGKWLFRIKVQTDDGSRPTLRQAAKRETNLFVWGFGLGLPLLSLLALLKSYHDLDLEGQSEWDRAAGTLSAAREINGVGYLGVTMGTLIVVASKVWELVIRFHEMAKH